MEKKPLLTYIKTPLNSRSGQNTTRFLTRELVHYFGGLGMRDKETIAIPKIVNGLGETPPVIII